MILAILVGEGPSVIVIVIVIVIIIVIINISRTSVDHLITILLFVAPMLHKVTKLRSCSLTEFDLSALKSIINMLAAMYTYNTYVLVKYKNIYI